MLKIKFCEEKRYKFVSAERRGLWEVRFSKSLKCTHSLSQYFLLGPEKTGNSASRLIRVVFSPLLMQTHTTHAQDTLLKSEAPSLTYTVVEVCAVG